MSQETINFNDIVTLELTKKGEEQYRAHLDKLNLPLSTRQYFVSQIQEGKVELPLSDVAHIFGPTLSHGSPNLPFKMEMKLRRIA